MIRNPSFVIERLQESFNEIAKSKIHTSEIKEFSKNILERIEQLDRMAESDREYRKMIGGLK